MSTNPSQSWSEWSDENHKAIEAAEAPSVEPTPESQGHEARCDGSAGSLTNYLKQREATLRDEYDRYSNCKQMQSIIAGQLWELEKMRGYISANSSDEQRRSEA